MNKPINDRVAHGGSINLISEMILEDNVIVLLSPGTDDDDKWERGYWYQEEKKFYRCRDHEEFHPMRCSPLPGHTLRLK